MNPLRLFPILASAGILLGANGLIMTLMAVRGQAEGFGQTEIGLMGTAYFSGFLVSSVLSAHLIRRSTHIRVFGSLCAIAGIGTLIMVLFPNASIWMAVRVSHGFVFAGASMVLESWLNQMASKDNRGRLLSIYRIVDLSCVTGAQFLLPLIGSDGFQIFVFATILFCAALLPVSLSRLRSPSPPRTSRLDPGLLWRLSPVACVGFVTIGLTNGAFRTVGPLYAQKLGLDVDEVALFISLGIAAGAIFQFPLGWMSDRIGRRSVLMLATIGAVGGSQILSQFGVNWIFVGGFLFGGFALPLYSLSVAHANDFAADGEFVQLAAGVSLFYALGAAGGSFFVSLVMDQFGVQAFFTYTSVVHGAFLIFVLYRITRRKSLPREARRRFVSLLRTSPAFLGLAGHHDDSDDEDHQDDLRDTD